MNYYKWLICLIMILFPVYSYAGGLHIKSARYGVYGKYCNALPHIQSLCEGKTSCVVNVNNKMCGDPYVGKHKYLEITYECNGQNDFKKIDEADSLNLNCASSGGGDSSPDNNGLHIKSARYGVNGKYCNALSHVQSLCEGKSSCVVNVNNKMCGDPYVGKHKFLEITYECNGQNDFKKIDEADSLNLNCASSGSGDDNGFPSGNSPSSQHNYPMCNSPSTVSYTAYVLNVPRWEQRSNDCAPQAATNILGFYNAHGYNGVSYSRLIPSGFGWHYLNDLLRNAMDWKNERWLLPDGTIPIKIDDGIRDYTNKKIYGTDYNFSVKRYAFSSKNTIWSVIKEEIRAGRPVLYIFQGHPRHGNHAVVLLGYYENGSDRYIIYSDNHGHCSYEYSFDAQFGEHFNSIVTIQPGTKTTTSTGIHILSATYGAGGRNCDATYYVANRCNGKSVCSIKVDNNMCGDPYVGIGKILSVKYKCNQGSTRYLDKGETHTMKIECK